MPLRKASTATSLEALNTVGIVPSFLPASYANLIAGYLLTSTLLKFIVDILLKKNFTEEYKNIPDIYNFKRAIILEMSGGTFFYNDFYKKIANTIQNTISNFWKNRLTLVKLGRLYSRNFFKNLKNINDLKSISIYKNKFTKPFLIVGAGESCENIIKTLSKNNLSSFNIVAVDAILPTLQANKIIPDFIVAVESQLAIEKAYIGSKKNNSINNNI